MRQPPLHSHSNLEILYINTTITENKNNTGGTPPNIKRRRMPKNAKEEQSKTLNSRRVDNNHIMQGTTSVTGRTKTVKKEGSTKWKETEVET